MICIPSRTVPQYLHIAVTPVDALHIGNCVELNLIIWQAWHKLWWVHLYTQIILRSKTVNFHCVSSKSTITLLSLVTFIIYIWRRYIQNVVRKPQGRVSVQRRKDGWEDNIKMDLNLIW